LSKHSRLVALIQIKISRIVTKFAVRRETYGEREGRIVVAIVTGRQSISARFGGDDGHTASVETFVSL